MWQKRTTYALETILYTNRSYRSTVRSRSREVFGQSICVFVRGYRPYAGLKSTVISHLYVHLGPYVLGLTHESMELGSETEVNAQNTLGSRYLVP